MQHPAFEARGKGCSPRFEELSIRRAGPSEGPAPKEVSYYLPNDPARQKTTGNQQHTSTKRYRAGYRNATRARQRRSRTAATARSRRRRSRSRSRSSVDVDVTTGSYALEASEHLVLADTQLLGNGAEVIRISILVLSERSLDLVTVHILDATSDRRLGEGRGSSR